LGIAVSSITRYSVAPVDEPILEQAVLSPPAPHGSAVGKTANCQTLNEQQRESVVHPQQSILFRETGPSLSRKSQFLV